MKTADLIEVVIRTAEPGDDDDILRDHILAILDRAGMRLAAVWGKLDAPTRRALIHLGVAGRLVSVPD